MFDYITVLNCDGKKPPAERMGYRVGVNNITVKSAFYWKAAPRRVGHWKTKKVRRARFVLETDIQAGI